MNRAVVMDMYPSKDLVGMVFGPVLATLSGVILAVSQDVNQGGISTQFLTIIASMLASTGVVGYALKRFVDNQVARAQEEREQERESRRIAHEHIERMFSQAERHATRMEELYIAERQRNDALVRDLVGTNSDS